MRGLEAAVYGGGFPALCQRGGSAGPVQRGGSADGPGVAGVRDEPGEPEKGLGERGDRAAARAWLRNQGVPASLAGRVPEESEWARAKAEELTEEFVCGTLLSLLLTGGKPVLDAVTGEDAEREVLDYLALLGVDKDAARPYVPELVRTVEAARETAEKIDLAGENADAATDEAEELDIGIPARQDALTDGLPEDIVETNHDIPPVTSDISRALIAEVQARGDKISPNDVLGITRDRSGKIVWLEAGHLDGKPSGLAHIMYDHEVHFNKKGIASSEIPEFILTTAARGRIIGYQGQGMGRAIYEIAYKGIKCKVAISIGSNGYIVGANPCGKGGSQ